MKDFSLPLFLLPFLIIACQTSEEGQSTNETRAFRTYQIDVKAKSVLFEDQIASLELLGFEESPESLLNGDVLFFKSEGGYVVVDEKAGDVLLFDENGVYQSKFNRKGDGPKEYAYMRQTQYREGLIETFVLGTKKGVQYDLEGNFLQKLELPYFASHVFYHNGGYLLGMGNQVGLDSVDHDVIFADEQMKPYAFALPFDKPKGVPLAGPDNEFRLFNDKVLFSPFWTDSVYQINDNQASPYLRFDFGDAWLWDEIPLSNDFNVNIIQGRVWSYTWVIGEDRIEINYMTDLDQPPGIGYIDRRTGKFLHYKFDWSERQRLPYMPLRFEGDELLAVFLADELGEIIQTVGDENVAVKGFLSIDEVLASENPVLVWVKFKTIDQ